MFSFLDELSGDGARIVTAVLKRDGHDVKSVFMPRLETAPERLEWSPEIQEVLASADMYMLSVLSCYQAAATIVSRFLKGRRPDIPVVFGGVHATAAPDRCLKVADLVFRGECEDSVVEFCRRYEAGENYDDVKNLCYLDSHGEMIVNPLARLPVGLDELPFPDYDIEDHFILDQGRVLVATMGLYQAHHMMVRPKNIPTYVVMTARGCPFVCTYCHQSELVNTYPVREYNTRNIRYKSAARAVEEIKHQISRMPFFRFITIADDDFLCRKIGQIRDFTELYTQEIALPFCVAALPASINEEKFDFLLDAGCVATQMGIQSGSDRVLREVYERRVPRSRLVRALTVLTHCHEKNPDFELWVDWIVDCPWETEDDVLESIEVARLVPSWACSTVFTLTFYPGTSLWNRAVREGLLDPEEAIHEQTKFTRERKTHSYLTYVLLAYLQMGRTVPVRLLSSRRVRWTAERLPKWILDVVWARWGYPR